jgi:hypothetical protein
MDLITEDTGLSLEEIAKLYWQKYPLTKPATA